MFKKLTNIQIHNNTIIIDGHESKVRVDGTCLEAALLVDDNYILLFVTFDCPFEEILAIYLLDLQQNRIIDKAKIYRMYYTDFFSDLVILSENRISFDFLIEGGWTLELFDKPKRSLTYLFPTLLVKRPFSLTRYFSIKNNV
ncbi:hypothetical protein [Gilliamella sp. W8145]|uniref:hypothetical protein n=1 Tax=Gilliamella sp. W8145 TaxID=2750990 RepID=UPI0018DC019B|nr:hypothetical protein [Gilliamella sp. W8145]MBI0103069.1 hypothetical protein [Gilliamella sp. W8145]